MASLCIRLFGRLEIDMCGIVVDGISARKTQELLCYLLLYKQRPHTRESLATLFWGEVSAAQARAYLRKALWQLHSVLEAHHESLLKVDAEWVQIDPMAELWLDVAEFEQTFARVQGLAGEVFDPLQAAAAAAAVDLYRGDLLEGSYLDWCLYERERLLGNYLALLDKLMGYCEASGAYEQGIAYGADVLRHDGAREQTHRRLMRLHYLLGDRTLALRQYQRCVAALECELGVEPTEYTQALCSRIKADEPLEAVEPVSGGRPGAEAVTCLHQVQTLLDQLHIELSRELQAAISSLTGRPF